MADGAALKTELIEDESDKEAPEVARDSILDKAPELRLARLGLVEF